MSAASTIFSSSPPSPPSLYPNYPPNHPSQRSDLPPNQFELQLLITIQDRCASYDRRRGTIIMATLPFILPLHEYIGGLDAKAIESQTSEYKLIKEEIGKLLTKGKAAGILRLVFHDAGTFKMDDSSGGMNGSIVYEVDRPENRSQEAVEAKDEVDKVRSVSWVDMIAEAGAEAVLACGGPVIPVQLGRLDLMMADLEGRLPEETLDARALKQCFRRIGLSTQELIAISGAHTIGTKGFGSPVVFDNAYYKILLAKPWTTSGGMTSMLGLPSDHTLVDDDECLRWMTTYANDQATFFEDLKHAYIKLVNSGASWRKL